MATTRSPSAGEGVGGPACGGAGAEGTGACACAPSAARHNAAVHRTMCTGARRLLSITAHSRTDGSPSLLPVPGSFSSEPQKSHRAGNGAMIMMESWGARNRCEKKIAARLIPMDSKLYEKYSRQILFAEIGEAGQQRLLRGRAALVGCGALGTSLANLLVRAGLGRLRIIDRDFVEASN